MSNKYWGKAIMTSAFLRNRLPTRAQDLHKSPYEEWTKKKPMLANLKVFDCHAYVHVPKEKLSKLDPRASLCRFLGYSKHEKAYRFEELSSGRVVVSRDAQFMEDAFDNGKHEQSPASRSSSVTKVKRPTLKVTAGTTVKTAMKKWTSSQSSSQRQHRLRATSGRSGNKQVSYRSNHKLLSSRLSTMCLVPSTIHSRTCLSRQLRNVMDARVAQVKQARHQRQI